MVDSAGNMKSFPYVPGMLPCPNSAPDSSTPIHFHPPEAGGLLVVDVEALEVLVFVEVTRVVDEVVVVVPAVPGRHWLYHGLEYTQV